MLQNSIRPWDSAPATKLQRLICLAMLGIASALPAQAQSPSGKNISWAIYDLPPSYIVQPPGSPNKLGDGIGDKILGMLMKEMPDYQHTIVLMTVPRIFAEMQAGKPVCVINVRRSAERDQLAWSTPLLTTPSTQLVLKQAELNRHPEWKNGVSLKKISSDASLHGLYQSQRSFGDKVDAILHDPANVGLKENSSASATNALKMVAMGRISYTIEYPQLIALRIRTGELPSDMTTVPILEAESYVEGHAMCTRNAWGLTVMRRIDASVQKLAATREYQAALDSWLPRNELQRHQRGYETFYQTRAKTSYCQANSCP